MDSLISVIMPVYNVDKYLHKSIETVLKQTYKNIELIIVNDGSKDNSASIIDEYAKKDSRVKAFHKENSGVSDTRNFALEQVIGKYIYFIDSDDYIEEDTFEKVINIYEKYNVDLICFGFYSEVENKQNRIINSDKINFEEKYYENKDSIKDDLVKLWDKHILYNIWNKVYLTDILKENNIKFPPMKFGEDVIFNREYLLHVKSMYNIEECLYHYIRERMGACTNKYHENLYDIRLKENVEFKEYFEKWHIEEETYIEFTSRRHVERTLGCIENIFKSNLKFKDKYKETKKIVTDDVTKDCIKHMKPNSKKIKIMLIPYKYNLILLAMMMGKMVFMIKKYLPGLFNGLKNRR